MGRVWRATDVVLHREVAIKELVPPPGLTPDERREMRDRSLREARAIARLNNINVVRVFDVLRTDADPWIVMEYVASRSLQDTLAESGPFPPVRAAEIGLGVLNALRAAHRAGVMHRDVKPGNVLLGDDGRVVLTDFGLATVPGDPNVTRTGLVLGSPAYIAPERARDGTAGPAADLWSLGATLYAAVEGASPFARPTAIATLAALATENPPQSRNAGPMKPVLNGLLRKDPAHRINAEEAERLLLRVTGRRSKLSFPMSPTMRRPGVGRERPALPGTPPVVPGSATGSAPVVPGPRPPVTPAPGRVARSQGGPLANPYGESGPATSGNRPVFAPGKASVGRPPQRPDAPAPLDATRLDTPPVQDLPGRTGKPVPPNPVAPAKTQIGESAQRAMGPGTRGVFGTISAAEIAHRRRSARPTTSDDPPPNVTPPGDRATVEQTAVAPGDAPPAAETAPPRTSRTQADERATLVQPAVESTPFAVTVEPGRSVSEQTALDRAAAEWRAREGGPVVGALALAEESDSGTTSDKSDVAAEVGPGLGESPETRDDAVEHVTGADEMTAVTEPDAAAANEVGADEQGADNAEPGFEAAEGTTAGEGTSGDAEPVASGVAMADSSAEADVKTATVAADTLEQVDVAAVVDAPVKEVAEEPASSAVVSTAEAAGTAAAGAAAAGAAAAGAAAAGVAAAGAATAGAAATGAAAVGEPAVGEPAVGARAAAGSSKASRRKGRGRAAAVKATSAYRAQKTDVTGTQDVSVAAAAGEVEESKAFAAEPSAEVAEASTEAGPGPEVAGPGPEVAGPGPEVAGPGPEVAGPSAEVAGLSAAIAEPSAKVAEPSAAVAEPSAAVEASADAAPSAAQVPAPVSETAGPEAPEATDSTAEDGEEDATGVGTEEATEPAAEVAPASAVARIGRQTKAADRDLADTGTDTDTDTDTGRTRTAPAKVAALRTTGKRSGPSGAINVPVARDSTTPVEIKAQKSVEQTQERDRTAKPKAPDSTTVLPGHVPGFNAPSRPAWTPMAVAPTAGKKGLTIFGTTLTRNQTLVGGVIVLALIALLAVLIPKAFGSDDARTPVATPTTAEAKATAAPTKAAAPAPTPSAQVTTAAPSSAAPSASASSAGTVAMPAGWHLYQDPTGFQVPVPDGASITRQGSEVYFRKDNRLLIVDQTDQPKPDPVADWTQQEHDRAGSAYRNYHRIKIVAVNYFVKAADWEFTYTTNSGNDQHADKRGVITSAHQAYGLSWYTSPDDWAASQKDLRLIYQGFKPRS